MITNKNMSNEDLLLKLIEKALILDKQKTISKREVERYSAVLREVHSRMYIKRCPFGRNI